MTHKTDNQDILVIGFVIGLDILQTSIFVLK